MVVFRIFFTKTYDHFCANCTKELLTKINNFKAQRSRNPNPFRGWVVHDLGHKATIIGHLLVPYFLYSSIKHYSSNIPIFIFSYPPTHIVIPLCSLHFPPFLSTFTYPPSLLWKMWKILWKTCHSRL